MENILVATPTYDGKVYHQYFKSAFEYTKEVQSIAFDFNPGDSLIPRARNDIITNFYYHSRDMEYTHILWQDADIYIPGHGLRKMLDRNVDVIGVPVPLKMQNNIQNVTEVINEVDNMFYKVKHIGTGVMLLSINIVNKLIEDCENSGEYCIENGIKIYNVFRVGLDKNNFYLSEDWSLCNKIHELGFDIYADSSIECTHVDSPRTSWHRPPSKYGEWRTCL